MLLNDRQIAELAQKGMITPYTPSLIRKPDNLPYNVISYGQSSYGYDIRLSPVEFLIFRHIPGTVMDPKNFNKNNLESIQLHHDSCGSYFILPHHSYGLGVALERLKIPPYITCLFLGKSTYARLGVIANLTPGEAGWEGNLTLEFSNSSGADCRVYVNEGIVQALFFPGEPCGVSYSDRSGKYQNQDEKVTLAIV
jgi:dCTP deaminase